MHVFTTHTTRGILQTQDRKYYSDPHRSYSPRKKKKNHRTSDFSAREYEITVNNHEFSDIRRVSRKMQEDRNPNDIADITRSTVSQLEIANKRKTFTAIVIDEYNIELSKRSKPLTMIVLKYQPLGFLQVYLISYLNDKTHNTDHKTHYMKLLLFFFFNLLFLFFTLIKHTHIHVYNLYM